MKRKLLLCLTLTLLLGVLSRQLSWAQCTNCVNTAVTGGNYDLTGNQTLCITGNVGDFNLNVSGTGNKICVATGATWTIGFGLNFNTSLTIDVYGTLNANGSYNVNGTGNQAVFNIKPGATMNTNTPGFGNLIRINNEGTLNFTNTGAITNEGSFTLINATTGVVSATATTLFKLGTNSYVENDNLMTFSNLENAESDIRNAQGATITIGRYFYNHGNIINDGQINTICGPFGSVACEFIVGDKGPGKIFSISNTGCMSVTGTTTFNGPGFINGTLEITGDLTINKPVSGANGRIIVNNGVSTISLSGAYNGTNMTFCDKNTAGNGFDVVQANNPATTVVYTVNCSPNLCTTAAPSACCTNAIENGSFEDGAFTQTTTFGGFPAMDVQYASNGGPWPLIGNISGSDPGKWIQGSGAKDGTKFLWVKAFDNAVPGSVCFALNPYTSTCLTDGTRYRVSVWVAVYDPANPTASATFLMDNNNGTVYTHPTPIVSTSATNNLAAPNWQLVTYEFDFNFSDGTPYFSFNNETASSRTMGMLFDGLVIQEVSCPALCVAPTNLVPTASPGSVAPGATVTLGVSASYTTSGSTTYTWSGPGISSPTATTVSSRTVAAPATAGVYTYTVLVSNGPSCTATATRSVTVAALTDGCPGNLLSNGSLENGNFNNFTTTNPNISGTLMTYGGSQSVFLSADPGGNTLPDTPITGFRANTGYWVDATTNGGLGAKDANRLFAIPANVGANKCLFPNSSLGFAYTSGNCYRICFWAAQFDPASPNNSALTSIFNFEYEDSFGVLSPGVASNFSIAPTATSTTGSFQSISWTLPASTNVKTTTGATYTGAAGQVVDWKTLNWQYICLDFTPAVTSDRMRIYLSTTNTNNGVAIDGICATACSNSATCAINVTATPGTCNSATNQYAVSGTISLTNAVAGTATITDGAKSTTVTVPAGATSVAYSLTGLTSGTGSHTVTVSLPGCGTATATYSAPASCTVPCTLAVTANASSCDPATNKFSVTGQLSFTNAPTAGVLRVRIPGKGYQDFTAPFTSPLSYSIGGLNSDGQTGTVVATFSNGTCSATAGYTAPVLCLPSACVSPQTGGVESYSYAIPLTTTNWTQAMPMPKFDTQGGTRVLKSVIFTVNQSIRNWGIAESQDTEATEVNIETTGTTSFSLNGVAFVSNVFTATNYPKTVSAAVLVPATGSWPGDNTASSFPSTLLAMPFVTTALNSLTDPTLSPSWVTNVTGDPTDDDDMTYFAPVFSDGSKCFSYSTAADLANFTGTGNLDLRANARGASLVSGAGNLVTQIRTAADAVATVTYVYCDVLLVCSLTATATPGTCNSATNQYAISGTISLTNAVAGTATITDGVKSTTVTVPAGATSVAYSLTGLTSGTGSHTVTVSLPGCGTATAIYAAPASCTVAPCSTSATAQANCNNNGTLDVTSDDYVNILLTPYSNVQGSRFILTATQNGNPISLSLSDGGSLTALSYAYPTPLRAPLGSAGNGNITLILTDVSNTTCITQVTVVDPGECAAAACVGSSPQTVTQSYRTRFQPTELNSVPLLLSKFDDGGGTRTLTGVKLSYGMFEGTNLLFENTAATPSVFRPTVTADIFIDLGATNLSTATLTATPGSQTAPASITVAAQGTYGGDVLYGNPPIQRLSTLYGMGSWLDNVMIDIYSDPRLDSRWVTNATGNPTSDDDIYVMPPQSLTFSGTNSYSATGDLAQFIGAGQIPLTASTLNGLTLSGGGGNLIYRQWTQAYAYATVEYTYICNSCTLVATATPGTCNSATNQYTVSGTVSLTNNLGGGTATITDGAKSTTVSIPAGATSVAYSLTGLISGTGSHTVTVSLPGCGTATATYNAPASCTVACPSPNCFTLAGQQMPMVFQFGYVGFGTYTTNSGSLTTATAISSAAPNLVNVITSSNIGLVGGNLITLSTPMQFAVGSTYTQTFTTASGSFTANLTVNSSVITGPYAREVEAVGFISSSNAAFALTPILYSASYTQNLGSGQINASFTLSSKAPSCGNLNTICPGSTQSVTLTAQAGITNVVWRDSTTNSIIGTGSTLIVVGTESFLAGGYEAVYYEGVDANGCVGKLCCMERISVTKVTATATPGTCNPATNQYAVSGTVSLTSATAGTATITDGAVSTTVTIPAGATAVAYSLTGLTSGTGSHTVTVGLPGCGTATATYTAPASCSVAATINVTSATVCYGNTATLTAAGCTGSVTWSNGTSGNTLVTPTLTQTTSYTATCTTASATTFAVGTVTVLPQPVLNLSASSTLVTTGTNVTLTASGCAGTVNWSNGSTGASIIVTPTQPTQTYSATCTTGPACFTTASIVVNTEEPANLVVTSATICAGSSATLTAAGCAGTVTWSNGTTGNTLVTPALTQTTSYTATCTTATSTTFAVGTVTVNPAVTATISAGSLSICAGQTTTLTASGEAAYVWSTGVTTASISVSAAGTYSVTATSAVGCSGTAIVTVVQNPVPFVTVTSATICAGSSATLTASGANSYLWSTGATTASIVVSPTATTTYSVTGTSSAGCSATATGTVTVLPQPVLNLSASSTLVTVGNSVTLTAQDCVGSIAWSNGSTGASIVVMPTQPTQTYSATCTTGPACFTTATIVVNTEEPANLVVTSATICAGSSATLTAAGCAGTVTWSNGTTGNTLVTPALTQTTSYTATCTTATSTTFAVGTVTVNPAVTATISAGSLSICAGQTTTLTASGGATYLWSTGATTASISVSAAGTYSVTATSTAGCSGTSAITIVENPAPIITVSSASICAGGMATLTASGADTYRWNTGATTQSISVSVAGTYSVTGTSAAGCSATATGSLTVFGQPTISPAILPAATVGVTYSQTLTGNGGKSPYTFAVVAGSLPQGLNLSTDGVLAGTPTDNAPASFTVSLTDANGCTAVQPYSTTATGLPKLELNKLVSKRQAQVGEVVSFTVVLANTGLASATGVVVSDTHTAGMSILPGSVTVSTGSFTPGLNGGQWAIASLPAGTTATLTYSASITGEGLVYNTASIPGTPTTDVKTCLTVPMQVCQGAPFAIKVNAPEGYSRYQWYLTAPGATSSTLVADGTLNSFTATLPGSYSVLIDGGLANTCPSQGCCPVVIEEVAVPSYSALVKNSSCVGSTPQADGQITLVNLGTAGRYYYQVSPGTSFDSAGASAVAAIPANGVVSTGLLPGNYTVRVWLMIKGQPACPRDLTVAVVETCACPTNVCVPVVVRKIK